jgi:hypothetical protein
MRAQGDPREAPSGGWSVTGQPESREGQAGPFWGGGWVLMSEEAGYSAEQIVLRSGSADVAYLPNECRSALRAILAVCRSAIIRAMSLSGGRKSAFSRRRWRRCRSRPAVLYCPLVATSRARPSAGMTQPPRRYLRWAGGPRERAIAEGNAAKGASMVGSGETLPTTKASPSSRRGESTRWREDSILRKARPSRGRYPIDYQRVLKRVWRPLTRTTALWILRSVR